MSNNRKILSVILALILVLSVFGIVPFSVNAGKADVTATAYTEGDFLYGLDGGNNASISFYIGKGGNVTIPSTLGGYPVTKIEKEAFCNSRDLTSITIPDTVTTIDNRAFVECSGLTGITIPKSVTYIDYEAFEACTNLASITVDPDNTVYDSRNNCNAIIKTESNELICGCMNTVIPDSVTSIGDYAFCDCTGLTCIDIPGSVTHIAYLQSAFAGCSGLKSITVDPANTVYDSRNNCNAIIITNSNLLIYGCMNTVIPDAVTRIDGNAFYDCTGLTSIDIPDSVTSIDPHAFRGCTGLTSVKLSGSLTYINHSTFCDCTSLTSVIIPNSVKGIDSRAFSGCTSLTSVIIPDSVTGIGNLSFYDCPNLTSVTIPASVKFFGESTLGINDSGFTDGFRIYGYEGSAAETYASKNHFTFIKLTDHQDKASGVSASVTDDVELRVADVLDQMPANTIKAYDISLLKNGKAVQPANVVTVKIPCDDPDAKVYRQETDGSLTDMNAVYRDGYLVFKTTHFSRYLVATGAEVDLAICGDADGDGQISTIDATILQRYLARLSVPYDEETLMNADVDGDGELSVIDVTVILRYCARIRTPYPVGQRI